MKIQTTLNNPNAIIYKGNLNISGQNTLVITAYHAEKRLVWPPNANSKLDSQDIVVNITPINYSPVVTIPRNQITIPNENQKFSINEIRVSDQDNQNILVSIEVKNGTITINNNVPNGLPTERIQGNTTKQVTLNGNVNLINKTLAGGVIYKGNKAGKDLLKVTANDGNRSQHSNISITVNDNPVLKVLKFVTTNSGRTITEAEAVNVVKSWLIAKKDVMASPYNEDILKKYTTGKYFNVRLGAMRWLQRTGSYWRFGSPSITPYGNFLPQGDDVVIYVKVYQNYSLYNAEIGRRTIDIVNSVYRYTLRFENGRWKIANSQKIG